MTSRVFEYQGRELDLFALADKWKAYVRSKLTPYLGDRVLEIGAGIGAVSRVLLHDGTKQWTCLEPDAELANRIPDTLSEHPARDRVKIICGVASDLEPERCYDTILYFDVLEHIEDDFAELRRSSRMLCEGGRLIVLAPAYSWLCSAFDKALGHFRRYRSSDLVARTPPKLRLETIFYLDSLGIFLSLGNKLLLRQSVPSRRQILLWDRFLIPMSRAVDRLIGFRAGRSIVAIWQRADRELQS